MLLLHQVTALAQVELFTVSSPAQAEPREFITLVFGIVSHQTGYDTFSFEVELPEGFSLVALPPPLELAPGGEGRVFLTLFVSSQARAGENWVILTAASMTDPAVSASARALVIVAEVPAVEVVPPPPGELEPGRSTTLVFTVWNRGNAIDRFMISASSRRGLELTVSPQVVDLLAGESAEVAVIIAAPADEEPGRDLITLIATSEVHPGVMDEATVAITILPPLPQAVGGTLYLEIPMDFRARVELSCNGEASSSLEMEGAEAIDERSLALSLTVADLLKLERFHTDFAAPEYEIELGDLSARLTPLVQVYGRGARFEFSSRALPARLEALGLVSAGEEVERVEISVDDVVTLRPTEVVVQVGGRVEFANLTGDVITVASPGVGLGPVHLGPGESLHLTCAMLGIFDVYIAVPGFAEEAAVVRVVGAEERLVETAVDLVGELSRLNLESLFFLRSTVQAGLTEATSSILSGRLHWEPVSGLTLEVEGAQSTLTMDGETIPDLGLRAFSSLKVGSLTTTLELLRLGTEFATARRDEEGFTVTQYLSVPLTRYSFLFKRTHDNVAQDPAFPTILTQRARIASLTHLGQGGPALGLQFDYSSHKSSGPPPLIDEETMLRGLRFSQPLGPLTLSFFEERTYELDHVLGRNFDSERLGLDLLLKVEELASLFRISQTTRYDLLSELTLERFVEVLIQVGLGLPWGRFNFTLERGKDSAALSLNADVVLSERQLSSMVHLSLPDEGELDFSLGLEFVGSFALPCPFIVTKGRIEGEVFIDRNGSGRRDEDEEGVEGLILQIDRTLARTDAEGHFRFPPLRPGEYRLKVEGLPVGLAAGVPLPLEVSLEAGEILYLPIPLRQVGAIRGVVFADINRNGMRDEEESGLPSVRVALENEGVEQDTFTDEAGEFLFSDLLPGRYLVRLDPETLPERYEPTTPTEVELQLGPGEVQEIEFGAVERPRQIIITFQPPVAQFTWSPVEPLVGEAVTFDGSASFDPDGKIVKWEWDFDGDGLTDAEEAIVEWSFPAAGDYPVTLTVTDNDGYTGSARRTITVKSG